ncbi:MAG: GTP pyrophosphokinase [Paracidovorax wautersii]|uniref:GTP pyrophosphokinase n=1 Tax=Paracidovorax wautersii TaxID=1177982 RepID=A0A7V8FLI9_9BURK|nr:MAG: GTP pyrophosphokinase [Paracidovorax wautersii]
MTVQEVTHTPTPIVAQPERLLDVSYPVSAVVAAASQEFAASQAEQAQSLARARAFAEPLIGSEVLSTGENALAHADAVAAILRHIGGSAAMQAAAYLVYACDHLNKPGEVIAKAFGSDYAQLALETTKLVQVQKQARLGQTRNGPAGAGGHSQSEAVRRMLLAFSRDLRVVMLRLASRLQTLRYYAATKLQPSPAIARESLEVFAPLANRLGIWQIKWEMEDLSFRFLEPDTYKSVARLLDEKRVEREAYIETLREQVAQGLGELGLKATVHGRPKHIYSIVRKMRGKSLDFDQVLDILALRVVVPEVANCYTALDWVHHAFTPIPSEFDDYIAKPKVNGYQSLHTVVRDSVGRPVEIQIRTQAMHDHAEHGVAAHWAYKEAGSAGYSGVSADSEYDTKIAILRQLLAWERDLSSARMTSLGADGLFDDSIYVFTPDAAIIDLPKGASSVDFAYALHTNLGHRCRGAKVDGTLVTLNTALQNGQTVEIIASKEGGPSRDWLNPELGFLTSPRAKAKVRAWFNAQVAHENVSKGREAVEKLLQREGKTSTRLEDLAAQLGFKTAESLFEVVGKDEYSLRNIETLLRPPADDSEEEIEVLLRKSKAQDQKSGVLVVGMDSLLTQLARCCKPAPPDEIRGFVTRGKGVSIHRANCSNFRELVSRSPERVIEVQWAEGGGNNTPAFYPVDIAIEAVDRQGLLRDISEVFSKENMNVIGVQTSTVKGVAWMTFTVEVTHSGRLSHVLGGAVARIAGVRHARRQ